MTGAVLVTGATGFVGRHLVERLVLDGPVVACARSVPVPPLQVPGCFSQQLDLLDRERVRHVMGTLRPSVVYHCAGFPHVAESWTNRVAPLRANVLATHYLLDALGRADMSCRVVVTGSAAVYAPSRVALSEDDPVAPDSPYASSKLAQEQLALHAGREDGLDVIVARSFNHTGPRQAPSFFVPSVARQIALIEAGLHPPVVRVGNLDARRDISDVRDVVEAYVTLARSGSPGTIYNVASGEEHSMRSVLDALLGLSRVEVAVATDPDRLRPHDIPCQIGDATRLRLTTGWRPRISFEQCLSDLLNYWRGVVSPDASVYVGDRPDTPPHF